MMDNICLRYILNIGGMIYINIYNNLKIVKIIVIK